MKSGNAFIISLLLISLFFGIVGAATTLIPRNKTQPGTSNISVQTTIVGVVQTTSSNCHGNIGCYRLIRSEDGQIYLLYPTKEVNIRRLEIGKKYSVTGQLDTINNVKTLSVISFTSAN